MKYGVVYYKDTDNIGDDIQNYAAMRFLPQIDYLIDREQLSEFYSRENVKVAVILNGWFLHNKFNWPPSHDIYPLCISMHFTKNDYMGIGYDFLNGIGGEYLKHFQPIGCRDTSTLQALEEKGIEGYLSGCMTLTLEKRELFEDSDDYVCLVDIPEKVAERVKQEAEFKGIKCKSITHCVNYKEEKPVWTERIRRVEELLDIYQNAKCVITKRLHCALPCLSLETPVLLLLNENEDDITRYSHFTDFLYVCTREEFLSGKANYDFTNPPQNKKSYLKDREQLISRTEKFISHVQEQQNIENFEKLVSGEEKWQKNILINAVHYTNSEIERLLSENAKIKKLAFEDISKFSGQYKKDTDVLNNYIQNLKKEEERLNGVILIKDKERERVDQEIISKNEKIEFLNQVVIQKDQEIILKNELIDEKNYEVKTLLQEYNEILNVLLELTQLVEELEEKSFSWNLFFSTKFKNLSLKLKINKFKKIIKEHNNFILDIDKIFIKINNIVKKAEI